MENKYTNLIDYVLACHKEHTDYKKEILKPLVEEAFKSKISKYSGIDSLTQVPVSVDAKSYSEHKDKVSQESINKLIEKTTDEILKKRKEQLTRQKELEKLRKKNK